MKYYFFLCKKKNIEEYKDYLFNKKSNIKRKKDLCKKYSTLYLIKDIAFNNSMRTKL